MFGRFRPFILTLLVMALSAFTAPQEGDLVELQGLVNARSQAKFRKIDDNKRYVLQEGTKAEVEEVKYFAGTGNYGLRVRLVNADGVKSEDNASMWVYYKVKNPALKLYSMNGNTEERAKKLEEWKTSPSVKALEVHDPKKATDAVVVQETPAIEAKPEAADAPAAQDPNLPETAPTPSARPTDQALDPQDAKNVVADVQALNQAVHQNDPQPVCKDCQEKRAQYETCDRGNEYFENTIDKLINTATVSQTLQTSITHPRFEACVRESMKMSGGPFVSCEKSNAPRRAERACISQNLVKLVQNGFSLAFDCMAPGINPAVASDNAVKRDMSRDVIALVNLESGFHMNAYSGTGAAGLGQFTQGTSDSMTRNYWDDVQRLIKGSSNPACQELNRMDLKPYGRNVCDRLKIDSGNPVVGVLYTMAYMKSLRNDIEPVMKRYLREAGVDVSSEFYEKLLGALANWGHNTGSLGITRPFVSLANTDAGQAALRSQNLDQVMKLLAGEVKSFTASYQRSHGHDAGPANRRAEEASTYYANVQKKMKRVEGKVGRECSL